MGGFVTIPTIDGVAKQPPPSYNRGHDHTATPSHDRWAASYDKGDDCVATPSHSRWFSFLFWLTCPIFYFGLMCQ